MGYYYSGGGLYGTIVGQYFSVNRTTTGIINIDYSERNSIINTLRSSMLDGVPVSSWHINELIYLYNLSAGHRHYISDLHTRDHVDTTTYDKWISNPFSLVTNPPSMPIVSYGITIYPSKLIMNSIVSAGGDIASPFISTFINNVNSLNIHTHSFTDRGLEKTVYYGTNGTPTSYINLGYSLISSPSSTSIITNDLFLTMLNLIEAASNDHSHTYIDGYMQYSENVYVGEIP